MAGIVIVHQLFITKQVMYRLKQNHEAFALIGNPTEDKMAFKRFQMF